MSSHFSLLVLRYILSSTETINIPVTSQMYISELRQVPSWLERLSVMAMDGYIKSESNLAPMLLS